MKKKTNTKELSKFLIEFGFLMCLVLLIYGVNIFWVGFHNLDLCHNEMSIQAQMDKKNPNNTFIIKETKVYDKEIWSLGECYLNGLEGITKGFFISILGAFALGYVK